MEKKMKIASKVSLLIATSLITCGITNGLDAQKFRARTLGACGQNLSRALLNKEHASACIKTYGDFAASKDEGVRKEIYTNTLALVRKFALEQPKWFPEVAPQAEETIMHVKEQDRLKNEGPETKHARRDLEKKTWMYERDEPLPESPRK